tara:strand:+ start:549 stop:734 length:186 start_codon:yes stop_codon:yes gene_type:complete
MTKKKKYAIFDISTGKFEESKEDIDFAEYLEIIEAEKQIARRIIKQKLDKILPSDYKESTD